MNVQDIRDKFIELYEHDEFFVDRKSNTTMLEIIGASFLADERSIFGTPHSRYSCAERNWYFSESTNINNLYGKDSSDRIPSQWVAAANEFGEINSNYGHLIFSGKYHCQREQVLQELISNPGSRRAAMIYTRPSIWVEYNENGKNDFICTNAATYYIRDKKLHCVVQMRSNDVVFGYKNDVDWQQMVLQLLVPDYNNAMIEQNVTFDPIGCGDIHWQVQNLHVYSRHFPLIEEAIKLRQTQSE